jgi:anti-sigma factor RsiW
MECERIEEILPLYIDGDLTADEAAGVSAHVARCELCAKSLETYMELENSLLALPETLPDPRKVASRTAVLLDLKKNRSVAGIARRLSFIWAISVATAGLILLVSRFDFVSAILSGQDSFVASAGSLMDGWTASTTGMISGMIRQIEAIMAGDPWILASGMIGFGMLIFTAGMAAALKTMR